MARLLKFWLLNSRQKRSFCEAGILLLLANLCIRTVPFRHIYRFLQAYSVPSDGSLPDRADEVNLVEISVSRMANLLPWKSLCLARSIAAFIMLRGRGIPAVMHLGVNFLEDTSLSAHAWIHDGSGVTEGISNNHAFTAVLRVGTNAVDQ